MKNSTYIPNYIPKSERIINFIWGICLVIYAIYGYFMGELYMPGRRGTEGTTFTGDNLVMIIVAMFLGALNLFITIVDHYDKRDNEKNYKFISRIIMFFSISLILGAFYEGFFPSITVTVIQS
ncbi:hypothetical protein [Thalassomonas sp. RHCl1]|uniref:hypothetical protein n=1 Tax=Thalassomonas sp. RHCl1 TaxID=2995320 RepID=UPI00248ACFCB|nr:hypothetical protein [Thalassomonas sp. RHCl1]